MHLKRQKIEKFWPVPRKGTKYLAVASHNHKESIPIVVIMRDVLNLVNNKKELKKLINEKQIQVNCKEIRDVNFPVSLFDIINLSKIKKTYRASFSENNKMIFEEIKESNEKTFKVIGKKVLSKNIYQLNLMHGINIITKEKANTGDSVIYNFKDKKISKVLKLEKGNNSFVLKGSHIGKKGKIMEILEQGNKKIAIINSEDKKINVWIKNIIITE